MKFSLGGDFGLEVLAAGSPSSAGMICSSGADTNEVEETVTAGGSGLQYDAVSDVYTYVWKTKSTWAGTCRRFTLTLDDGTTRTALFRFR